MSAMGALLIAPLVSIALVILLRMFPELLVRFVLSLPRI